MAASEAGPHAPLWRKVGSYGPSEPSQKTPTLTRPTRQTGNNPGSPPQVFNPSIRRQIYINPAGKSMVINQSIPPRRLPPIQRQFVRKNLKIADKLSLRLSASLPSSWPKQKKRRHVLPTKTRPDQARGDATFFPDQNTGKPSQMKTTLEIRQMSVFGFTRGNVAQRSDRKPEENQRNDQNQPNPGLIGQDVKKSLTGGGWQTWVTYTRLPGYPGV